MTGNRYTGYAIALQVSKRIAKRKRGRIESIISEVSVKMIPYDMKEVRVIASNKVMHYAILELIGEGQLIPIPISIADVPAETDLKVFHYPVTRFWMISPHLNWEHTLTG